MLTAQDVRGAVGAALIDHGYRVADQAPTLRDRFAMAALSAVVPDHARENGVSDLAATSVAADAYAIADAMLLARAKPIDSQFAEVGETKP